MYTNRSSWTQEEDEIIKRFVLVQGLKKWTKIARTIKSELGIDGRTGKQCRERWHNTLDPDVKKETWTEEEERKLFDLQSEIGNKWSEIALMMPGRTENAIKNCFYSAIRRNLRKYNKGRLENEKLKGSLNQLLNRPRAREILMEKNVRSKTDKHGIIEPIQIKINSTEEDKPNDIVIPSISPSTYFTPFRFSMSPSTTPNILSVNYGPNYFDFSDQVEILNQRIANDFNNSGLESPLDLMKSGNATPNYFFPAFSLNSSFQHNSSPRNSS